MSSLPYRLAYVVHTGPQSSYQSMSKHWDQYTALRADMAEYTQLYSEYNYTAANIMRYMKLTTLNSILTYHP